MQPVLISSPNVDEATKYGSHHLRKLAGWLAAQNIQTVYMRNAILSQLEQNLEEFDPALVIMGGHGGSKGVLGINDHVILGTPTFDPELNIKIFYSNTEWMKDRIVYLFTCFSGRVLAQKLIDAGAKAVVAYKSAFIFNTVSSLEPSEDFVAEPYFNAALQLPIQLALDHTLHESVEMMMATYMFHVETAEARGDELQAKYLNHDAVNIVALGDLDATLSGIQRLMLII